MKKLAILALSLISILGVSGPSFAISLSYTDTTTCLAGVGPACGGNAITYTLTYPNSASGNATFTIQNSTNTTGGGQSWFVGWALFQFDQATQAVLSSLSAPGGTGPWTIIGSSTVNVLTGGGNYSGLPPDGKSGFVVTSLIQGNTPNITQGWFVNDSAGTGTFTFNYNLPSPGVLSTDAINFLVGYYDGLNGSGNPVVNRLSATLVPEPGTLLLLGSGLAAAGIWGRRVFRKHEK